MAARMRLQMFVWGMVVAALIGTALPSPAHAAGGDAAISPEARRHVEEGVTHYDAGRYQQAIDEFELAYRLSRRPALLFNIARAEGKLGHDDIAIAFLRRYLEERPDAPDASSVMAEIDARQRALEASRDRMKAEAEAQAARKQAEELTAQARAQKAAPPPAAVLVAAPPPAPPTVNKTLRTTGAVMLAAGPALALVGLGVGMIAVQASNDVARMTGNP